MGQGGRTDQQMEMVAANESDYTTVVNESD
jgi:hypothetical protein